MLNKLLTILCFLIVTSCSAEKKLNDMHDATMDLDKQTNELNGKTSTVVDNLKSVDEKTSQLVTTGKALLTTTDSLEEDSIHGNTLDLRTKLLPALKEKQSDVSRITSAAQYQMAHDFQLWTGEGGDSLERRNTEMSNALEEFFGHTEELIKSTKIIINPMSGDKAESELNALVATLHVTDRIQDEMLVKHPEIKPLTMLSAIEEGLLAEKEISGGKSYDQFPSYVKKVLENKSAAIYILKTRFNYLSYLSVAALVKQTLEPTDKAHYYLKKLKLFTLANAPSLAAWTSPKIRANISDFTPAEIEKLEGYVQLAVETRDYLKAIGIKAERHPSLEALISLVDLSPLKGSPQLTADPKMAELLPLIENVESN